MRGANILLPYNLFYFHLSFSHYIISIILSIIIFIILIFYPIITFAFHSVVIRFTDRGCFCWPTPSPPYFMGSGCYIRGDSTSNLVTSVLICLDNKSIFWLLRINLYCQGSDGALNDVEKCFGAL